MTELATPFRPYAAVAATVVSRAPATTGPSRGLYRALQRRGEGGAIETPAPLGGVTAKLRSVPRRRLPRARVAIPVVRPAEGTTHLRAVQAADEAIRLAVGRTLAQRIIDAFRF